MYYQDQNAEYQTAGLWTWVLLPFVLFGGLILGTTIPGLPVSYLAGHEFGAAELRYPLSLPVIRPVYLKRGESVAINYRVALREGRLRVSVAYADNLAMSLVNDAKDFPLSLSLSASGETRYVALRDGYYRFGASADYVRQGQPQCSDIFTDSYRALFVRKSGCPIYNVSYLVTIGKH